MHKTILFIYATSLVFNKLHTLVMQVEWLAQKWNNEDIVKIIYILGQVRAFNVHCQTDTHKQSTMSSQNISYLFSLPILGVSIGSYNIEYSMKLKYKSLLYNINKSMYNSDISHPVAVSVNNQQIIALKIKKFIVLS